MASMEGEMRRRTDAHNRETEEKSREIEGERATFRKQQQESTDAYTKLKSEGEEVQRQFQRRQQQEADDLRTRHRSERESDVSSNKRRLEEVQRELEKKHRDDQERLEAVHRDTERRLQQQLDVSRGGFATDRAELERTHKNALSEGERKLRALQIEKEEAAQKQVGESDLEKQAHASMVGQIQRDLDKSQNDQKELQSRLKVVEDRQRRN